MRLFILFFLFCAWPVAPFASEQNPEALFRESVDSLIDTELNYDLGFLWLDQVAVANFKLQKSLQPGIYIGSLSGKAVGLAAPLTGYRKQQYVSMMKLMPDGRFRSIRYTSQKEKNGILRAKVFEFDYERGEVTYLYYKNNKLITENVLPLDIEQEPSDIITTYYNLVAGAYGPQTVGAHYEIPTYDRSGISDIVIDFIPASERPKKDFFSDDLLICRVVVDQDVFDTKDGVIYIGYDAQMRPARGIVTDMIGLGDVRGILR